VKIGLHVGDQSFGVRQDGPGDVDAVGVMLNRAVGMCGDGDREAAIRVPVRLVAVHSDPGDRQAEQRTALLIRRHA